MPPIGYELELSTCHIIGGSEDSRPERQQLYESLSQWSDARFQRQYRLSRGMQMYNISFHYIRDYIEKIVGDEYQLSAINTVINRHLCILQTTTKLSNSQIYILWCV